MTATYLLKRLLFFVLVMWTAATINFFIPKLSSRNPILERLQLAATQGGRQQTGLQEMVKSYEQQFGLDKPLLEQYLIYLGNMARFDLGYSISQYPRRVIDVIMTALPWTIGLALVTTLISFALGTLLGALIAWPKAPRFLRYMVPPLMTLQAIPFYVFALILIYVVAFRLRLFPLAGAFSRGAIPQFSLSFILDLIYHATLPALSIILTQFGGWALGMRGLMVMVEGEDYITYAEAKGLKDSRIFRYALRNALLPQMTGLILNLGFIVFGTSLIEGFFGYPGLGALFSGAIASLDYYVIYGLTMILVLAISIATLLMDLIYPLLDPRIRYERG